MFAVVAWSCASAPASGFVSMSTSPSVISSTPYAKRVESMLAWMQAYRPADAGKWLDEKLSRELR